jgi:hypothetical protein
MTPRGTHRIKNAEDIEDGIWVIDAGMGFEVSETKYVAHGYAPPIETLPWDQPGSVARNA